LRAWTISNTALSYYHLADKQRDQPQKTGELHRKRREPDRHDGIRLHKRDVHQRLRDATGKDGDRRVVRRGAADPAHMVIGGLLLRCGRHYMEAYSPNEDYRFCQVGRYCRYLSLLFWSSCREVDPFTEVNAFFCACSVHRRMQAR